MASSVTAPLCNTCPFTNGENGRHGRPLKSQGMLPFLGQPCPTQQRWIQQNGTESRLMAGRGVRVSVAKAWDGRFKGAPPAREEGVGSELAKEEVSLPAGGNPIGIHALVWAGGWTREECERTVKGSAALGYDLVEIPVLDPASIDTEMTKAVLAEYGISASASLGLSFDADISSGDADVAARGEKVLLDALDVVSGVGGKYLVGVIYSAIGKYPTPFDWSGPGHANLVRSLRKLADVAADRGVTLGLEVVNRYESNVLNTSLQAMSLIEDIGRPNVMVHLDAYHMNIEEGNLARAVEACGPKLAYFHIGESHRGYLGTGTIDWSVLFRALAKANYRGPMTFEAFSSRIVSPNLSNNLCVWRNLFEDSNDLAFHAKEFIDVQWFSALRSVREPSSY